jgi:hypothetical protein
MPMFRNQEKSDPELVVRRYHLSFERAHVNGNLWSQCAASSDMIGHSRTVT